MDSPSSLDIFIIEDDVDASSNLCDILELDDHRVTTCPSAAAALKSPALATANVILLDWKLPDGSALELLPQLAEAAPRADVVIVTGYGDFERAVSALREGASDYLLKPINAASLQASIRRLAHRQWLVREKARSDELFRHLVEAAPSVIIILRRDLTIAYFSPYAEQVTGYRAQDVEGQSFAETMLSNLDIDAVRLEIDELFLKGDVTARELQIRRRDGASRWLIWNARALTDVDGQPAILVVGQDVTEQKLAVERLVQSERLAAIGEAMTGLAHESRNALQRSQAYLELLASELEGQTEQLELVGQIQRAQNHLHQLYEEVRQYAAPLRINAETCDLAAIVQETWAHLEVARKDRNATLEFSAPQVRPTCPADRFMLEQVFRNILENALAACPDPVKVVVEFDLHVGPTGPSVRIVFRDNGPGLTPEQRLRIFDPFYTTKTRGTGLGMTLAKRIVQAHGGTISVGDGPGGEIVVQLPVAI